jgi:hypothetical protein
MEASKSVLGAVLLSLLAVAGCPPVMPVDRVTGPDVAAVVTVVKAVYRDQGRIIFLGSADGSVDSALLAEAETGLQADLGVRVLPDSAADRSDLSLPVLTPKDPATGEVGVAIELDQFQVVGPGRLAVTGWYARSGLDAQGYDIVLERAGDGWVIVQMNEGAVA